MNEAERRTCSKKTDVKGYLRREPCTNPLEIPRETKKNIKHLFKTENFEESRMKRL